VAALPAIQDINKPTEVEGGIIRLLADLFGFRLLPYFHIPSSMFIKDSIDFRHPAAGCCN
jgi:hypothetical protein